MNTKNAVLALSGLLSLVIGSFANGDDAMFIDEFGNVGVGTSNPLAALHVLEPAPQAVDMIRLDNPDGPARLVLVNQGIVNDDIVDQKWIFNSNGTLRLSAGTDGPEFVLSANGDLRILGTLTAGVSAQTFPDYVFGPQYELMPIEQVKAYVDENLHLPGIPSASEVQESGINMTQMQVQLLKKVEELTLYTYQQQQMINELEKALADLRRDL